MRDGHLKSKRRVGLSPSAKTILIVSLAILIALVALACLGWLNARNRDFVNFAGYGLLPFGAAGPGALYNVTGASATFNVPEILPVNGSAEQMVFISNKYCMTDNSSGCRIVEGGTRTIYSNDSFSYFTFFDFFPNGAVSGFRVNPGDLINVTITEVGAGVWNVSVSDLTNSKYFSVYRNFEINKTEADFGILEWLTLCQRTHAGNTLVLVGGSCEALDRVHYANPDFGPTITFSNIRAVINNETYDLCDSSLVEKLMVRTVSNATVMGSIERYLYEVHPIAYPIINGCEGFSVVFNN